VISGYLINNNPSSTKIALAIYSISLSRLVEHFGDNEPKKVKTMISFVLNWHARAIKNSVIETIKNKLEAVLENQKEELAEIILTYEMINDKILEINKSLSYQIVKMINLYSKEINDTEEMNLPDDKKLTPNDEEIIDTGEMSSLDYKKLTLNDAETLEKKLIIMDLNIIRNKIFMTFIFLQDFYEKWINIDDKFDEVNIEDKKAEDNGTIIKLNVEEEKLAEGTKIKEEKPAEDTKIKTEELKNLIIKRLESLENNRDNISKKMEDLNPTYIKDLNTYIKY
ncbi:2482_t:CDS:2, partial [Dentiscutata erythropus]